GCRAARSRRRGRSAMATPTAKARATPARRSAGASASARGARAGGRSRGARSPRAPRDDAAPSRAHAFVRATSRRGRSPPGPRHERSIGATLRRMSRAAYLIDGIRSPFGRYGGALAGVRADDLAAAVIAALVGRTKIPVDRIDDVILGCANQA